MKLHERSWYPWLLVLCYSALGVTFPAATTQYSMSVTELARVMGVSGETVLWAETFRAACLVFAMFLSGYAYNRLGLRKAIALGLTLQITPQFLLPLAVKTGSLPFLFLCKGIQGCNSLAFPLYIASIVLWVHEDFKGLATAIFNGSFVAGAGLGAWIAGKVIPLFGWEYSFYIIGGLGALFALPAVLLTRDKDAASPRGNAPPAPKRSYGPVVRMPVTWLLVVGFIANTWITQAVNVDMPVYSAYLGYEYGETGRFMALLSLVTVTSSVLSGGISDRIAARSANKLRARCIVMGCGYAVSIAASLLLPDLARSGIGPFMAAACVMMFGAAWAGGIFWALPSDAYPEDCIVAGTSFCSSASNIPNPIAPMVVGILLGGRGLWRVAWYSCALLAAISLLAILLLSARRGKNKGSEKQTYIIEK